ncbi:putative inner membrane protein [Rodentibacter pneumotropicus]|uniref:Putative inner membrane protein n=1 Tax=Rodentibacter pneumotropicus TaxID=758 RepID=A0A3S4U0W6_9PAST|nr:putative inner membrane protein [Rodentibacter pneumotropicus]
MILGMFAGCISAALWANNVKWRNQPYKRRIIQALIGGALAGFGARLAMGCNLASLFTGIPQFSVHAWFFTIATAIGTYFGVKFTLLPMFRIKLELKKGRQN